MDKQYYRFKKFLIWRLQATIQTYESHRAVYVHWLSHLFMGRWRRRNDSM